MNSEQLIELKVFAARARIEVLKMIAKAGGNGHIGGSLSTIDILAVLYNGIMRINPKNPIWDGRDYFILSKGHGGPGLYATLALKGYFPLEVLQTLNQSDTCLPSHCDRNKTIGVDMSAGSLGQGAVVAMGVALGMKIQKKSNRVFSIVGDGEMNEGTIWEMAEIAPMYKLNNLIIICDNNKLQLDGSTHEVIDLGDRAAKFREFGWFAIACNGNEMQSIVTAFDKCAKVTDRPCYIDAHTVKGKGWKEIEGLLSGHNISAVTKEDVAKPIAILEKQIRSLR